MSRPPSELEVKVEVKQEPVTDPSDNDVSIEVDGDMTLGLNADKGPIMQSILQIQDLTDSLETSGAGVQGLH